MTYMVDIYGKMIYFGNLVCIDSIGPNHRIEPHYAHAERIPGCRKGFRVQYKDGWLVYEYDGLPAYGCERIVM